MDKLRACIVMLLIVASASKENEKKKKEEKKNDANENRDVYSCCKANIYWFSINSIECSTRVAHSPLT